MQALRRCISQHCDRLQRACSSASLIYQEHGKVEDVLQLVSPEVGRPGPKEVLVRMMAVSSLLYARHHAVQSSRLAAPVCLQVPGVGAESR